MSKIGRAGDGPSPQPISEDLHINSSPEKSSVSGTPPEVEQRPQSSAKNGSAKILERKMQEVLKQTLLQRGTDKAQGSQGKSQIDIKLAQVDYKLKIAQDTKEKIAGQIETVQKEVARIQGELKNLKTPLDAAGEAKKQSLERQVDQLMQQTKVALAGAGVDTSNSVPAGASLEEKLQVLGGIKHYAGDALKNAETEVSKLQKEKTQLQAEKDLRMSRKEEIGTNIKEVHSKIQNAIETKDKVTAHLSGLQKEIQGARKEINELREQIKQLQKMPGDIRNPSSEKGRAAQALKMKEQELESKLNHLLDQSGTVLRGAMKELTSGSPGIDTSTVRNAPLETKLKALEGLDQHLRDLLTGTSDAGTLRVSVGDSQVTAKGLNDYISKLQLLEKKMKAEQRRLEE